MFLTLSVQAEPSKVMSLKYDDSSSLVYINVDGASASQNAPVKFVRLTNPNRIYFDINEAVLIGPKQQLIFEKSNFKEIRLAQFSTNPDVVRAVVTFEEDFDTSKIKLLNLNGNVLLKIAKPEIKNDYFNNIYDEDSAYNPYSSIVVNSQVAQKVEITPNTTDKVNNSVMQDIQKAFADSTLSNTDGKTYDSIISIDLSSNLKLRTKYFINGYYLKNGGLLVSGFGQMTAAKMFTLDSPKRVIIDLPNTFVDKKIRNRELNLCPDASCKDSAKIGQFEFNKARIVITTETPEKYIPVYSADAQSMLFINADKLNHIALVSSVANLQKAYVNKINSKTSELILQFTNPIVHSVLRSKDSLTLYLFNVRSYNEPELIKTLNNTYFNRLTVSLLPQIGVKAGLKINSDDVVQVSEGVDGRAIKITIASNKTQKGSSVKEQISDKKAPIKNKIVLDPGHGGSDYGAIREGINEKDITLDITKKVASMLKSKGYKTALTRTDDTYLGLQERCDFTEAENPEIFVSIHVNSAVATEPYGIETHYYHEPSKELADIIQKHLAKNIDTKDRGVIKSKFYVINHTEVPAVLVEIGFLSNPEERAEIITEKRKQATAKAITAGIIEYLKKK